jgi:prolipoprotein diacylglyceryltransferase
VNAVSRILLLGSDSRKERRDRRLASLGLGFGMALALCLNVPDRKDSALDLPPTVIHAVFDVLAWGAASAMTYALAKSGRIVFPVEPGQRASYYAVLLATAGLGAYLFGTINLYLSGKTGVARSIEGAMFGAILGVEGYKHFAGVTARTGARFAAPLAIGIVIGRIGCFYTGIDDFTCGAPTNLPWAHDFGDGIPRHPAPLYESGAMALFLIFYLNAVLRNHRWTLDNGLYLVILWYSAQRFLWEFLKPYAAAVGPLTIFQLLSIWLAIYACFMLATSGGRRDERPVPA